MTKSQEYVIRSVIVTGGTGVTGNALVRYLLRQHIKVTALIRPASPRKIFLPIGHPLLTIISCSMKEYSNVSSALKQKEYDAFFHLAWDGSMGCEKISNRNNCKLQNQNVFYSLEAVELCHFIKCPIFVMTGSQAEYGRKMCMITENMRKEPDNAYGMAKLCAEKMTRIMCASYGIRHIWPILFSIYGPYDASQSLIDTTIRGLIDKKYISYTAGEQQWDYLYSEDAARALLMLAKKGEHGESYNVANGTTRQIRSYIKEIYQILSPGKTPRLGEIPYNNNIMFLGANISKLRKTIGFIPKFSFSRGIKEIYKTLT